MTVKEVRHSLFGVNVGKAIGPDMIPNKILKEFAPELALPNANIYNCSLEEGSIPDLLNKCLFVNPLPKVSPAQSIQTELRTILMTCTIAKLMEGFARSRLDAQISDKLVPRQYAREGHSTTDALLDLLHAIHEVTERGNCGTRVFFLLTTEKDLI